MTYFKNLEICINFPLTPSVANNLSCVENGHGVSPDFSSAMCLCYLPLPGRCIFTLLSGLVKGSLKKDVWRCCAPGPLSVLSPLNTPSLGQCFSSWLQFIYQGIVPRHKDPSTNGFNLLSWNGCDM